MPDTEIVFITDDDGNLLHDIINVEGSTVNAVLNAFEDFCGEKTASCYGCVGCCQERVPITSVDAWQLMKLLPEASRNLAELTAFCLNIEKLPDGAVDIMLRRDEEGCCIFMDKENSCCKIHTHRTFACASHYCLPRTESLSELRSIVINQGMDELVRLMIEQGIITGRDIADYSPNAFTGKKEYSEIKLKDLQ